MMRVHDRAGRSLALAAAFGAALLGAGTSHAQVLSRLSLRLEGGGSLLVSSPQSDRFGFGYMGRLDAGFRVAGPFALHLFGAVHQWPENSSSGQFTGAGPGRATLVGAGVGVEPALTPRVRLRLEGDAGLSLNGSGGDARFTWGVGVGALFGLARVLDLGPIVRMGGVLAAPSESADQGGPGSGYFVSFGLVVALHGAEDEPAAPTPEADPALAPAPTPPTQQVVSAPVGPATSATPTATTALPIALPTPAPTPAPPVEPTPAPAPGTAIVGPVVTQPAVEEEPHGRHRRRGRHGREREHRSRERRGHDSGGDSGGGGHHRRHRRH